MTKNTPILSAISYFLLIFCAEDFAYSKGASRKDVEFPEYNRGKPFFWKKEKVLKRLLRDRKVLVSVNSDSSKGKKQLDLSGVSVLDIPFEFVRKTVVQYEKLKGVSPGHFRKILYNPGRKELFIHGVALKWHAKMLLQMKEELIKGEDKKFKIHFFVKSGSFQGMKGFFLLEELRRSTDVVKRRDIVFSMTAFYESEKLPMPAFLLNFGLEIVLKTVAVKMRDFLFMEYKNTKLVNSLKEGA